MLIPSENGALIRRGRNPAPPRVVETFAVPEAEQGAGDPAALGTLAGFIWRRKWVLVVCAIGGLLAGAAATFVMKPVYRGRTSLQLEGFNDQALYQIAPVSPAIPNASPENYLQNEVKLVESNTLARRVADKLHVEASSDQRRIELVKKALTVRTSLQSQVIEIFYENRDPYQAAHGANAVATEFMNLNREARWQLVQDTTEWLNKQATDLKGKLESLNAQLQEFATRAGLIFSGDNNTAATDRLRGLQEAYTHAEADRAAKQARYEAALANAADINADANGDSPLHQYQADLATMRRQLAELRTIYAPDYYKVTRLQAQIDEMQAAINKERKAILQRRWADYQAAAGLERMLSGSLAHEMRTVEHQTDEQRQYNVLKNEVETTQKLYDSVLEKSKAAGAELSMRMTNIRVIDPAMPPQKPYSPKPALNLAAGLAAGMLFGVAWIFVHARPGKVKEPGELVATNFRELGVVPSAKDVLAVQTRGEDPGGLNIWRSEQPSLLKESFRAALTSILFSARGRHGNAGARARGQVFVVASIDMAEGKTTIATNLGIASAERKYNVLLIDADLRRPRLHERFQLSNGRGLAELLRRRQSAGQFDVPDIEQYVQPTRIRNLSVLTSGAAGSVSPELLYSSDLSALLDRLERRFDVIFIDAPPMMLYSDARILGRLSDGVVMVVRANKWRHAELASVYETLAADRIPILGTILNDWKMDAGQARLYGRYYGEYSQGCEKAGSAA